MSLTKIVVLALTAVLSDSAEVVEKGTSIWTSNSLSNVETISWESDFRIDLGTNRLAPGEVDNENLRKGPNFHADVGQRCHALSTHACNFADSVVRRAKFVVEEGIQSDALGFTFDRGMNAIKFVKRPVVTLACA